MQFLQISMMVFTLVASSAAAFAECACGPDYCQGDPRYQKRLDEKKKQARDDHYPERLVALLDRGGACFARIDRAPDGFTIRAVTNDGFQNVPWDEDNKRIADTRLKKGEISLYYEMNASRAFKCCNEKPPEAREDWNAKHDVSRSVVIECKLSGGAVACN